MVIHWLTGEGRGLCWDCRAWVVSDAFDRRFDVLPGQVRNLNTLWPLVIFFRLCPGIYGPVFAK